MFPCPCCLQPADGSHQCGGCFKHVHVFCASPFKDSPEGFGQILSCGLCVETSHDESATQVWAENDAEEGDDANQTGDLVQDVAKACGEQDEKNDAQNCQRLALASAFKDSKAGKGGTKSHLRKWKHKEGRRVSRGSLKKYKPASTTKVDELPDSMCTNTRCFNKRGC